MLCERGMASEVNLDEIVGIYTSQVRPYQGPLFAHALLQQSSWQLLHALCSLVASKAQRGLPGDWKVVYVQTKALWIDRLKKEKSKLEGSPLPEVVSKAPTRLSVAYPFSSSPLLQEQV